MTPIFTYQLPLHTAVLFLVFNRPETTARVFEAIREARPTRLYIAADGPRVNREGEEEKVNKVREIATAVDWHCKVKKLFREKNLGCKLAVSGGITWFFEHEDQGIILEDDCLPHQDFFNYCEDLLARYKDNTDVLVINGNNFQNGIIRGEGSYYFSQYFHSWGWATWQRAWGNYQGDMSFWPRFKKSTKWKKKLKDKVERIYWKFMFDYSYLDMIDSWALPWLACVWYQDGICATPNVNLVSNIGFGANSTHTLKSENPLAEMPTKTIGKIYHPKNISLNIDADRATFNNHFGGKNLTFKFIFLFLLNFGIRLVPMLIKKTYISSQKKNKN